MADDSKDIKQNIIKALDKVIKKGDWDSLFFSAMKKRLIAMREKAVKDFGLAVYSIESEMAEEIPQLSPDRRLIYVSIYQADSRDLNKWQSALRSLVNVNVSRPIYTEEKHVQQLIKSKQDPKKEAYLTIRVLKNRVIEEPNRLDRAGHQLLSLKPDAIQLANISHFTYNSKVYKVKEGVIQIPPDDDTFKEKF